jgi:hypothetical protein
VAATLATRYRQSLIRTIVTGAAASPWMRARKKAADLVTEKPRRPYWRATSRRRSQFRVYYFN